MSTIEELLVRNSSGSGLKKIENTTEGIRCAHHATYSIRERWHYLRRHAAVARPVYFARGLRPRSLLFLVFVSFECHCQLDGLFNIQSTNPQRKLIFFDHITIKRLHFIAHIKWRVLGNYSCPGCYFSANFYVILECEDRSHTCSKITYIHLYTRSPMNATFTSTLK
jgi:hypothetical protein